ncbi:MAG: YajQ family cyclic di-GMP-binding protein [Pseudomonadales bacterium]|jgi:hypothetical protein|nr:YajQ family cyclic di-GMP-binding protein [Pseudomonadales bacterium]MDP7144095.1 YajQ family cyclic di-GMP-binding protein [Pseudomonadales bacterium]MDP7359338.1 YajQ family cyclic di-GMP-binding protein [Pseudomonadales bacterium]MDP7594690.1 YajQ family cyclic di-GMP-binding protein [Pseudomonadales bacterium]HJN50382.1 YajQ family cyclic di-GMP-binding protein [Pseudomonadales bacterium]|tara:strand:+ start:2882 stop:3364 length:483 start_codon:yes stop_codon:yes gene_type:complete
MPSFDVVSEVDIQEVNNAMDQANREVTTRFDFKGVGAKFEREDNLIQMTATEEFQLKQMLEILKLKLVKRSVNLECMQMEDPVASGKQVHQQITFRQGIDSLLAKKMVKMVKDQKMKVQAAIQGEKIRVSGKKRDDLQRMIATLREMDVDLPLQFINFRD